MNCPRRDQISAELWSTQRYQQLVNESREFLNYVSEKAGVSPPYRLQSLVSFYDAVWREVDPHILYFDIITSFVIQFEQ